MNNSGNNLKRKIDKCLIKCVINIPYRIEDWLQYTYKCIVDEQRKENNLEIELQVIPLKKNLLCFHKVQRNFRSFQSVKVRWRVLQIHFLRRTWASVP